LYSQSSYQYRLCFPSSANLRIIGIQWYKTVDLLSTLIRKPLMQVKWNTRVIGKEVIEYYRVNKITSSMSSQNRAIIHIPLGSKSLNVFCEMISCECSL